MLKFATLPCCTEGVFVQILQSYNCTIVEYSKYRSERTTGENKNWRICEVMKKTNKLMGILLAAMLLWASAVTALAYDQVIIQGGLKYGLDGWTGTATVVGTEGSCGKKLTIPDTVTHNGRVYPVTGIGQGAFCNCRQLVSVELPGMLRHIDEHAFSLCINLASMLLPPTLRVIGDCAFYGCSGLQAVWFMPPSHLEHVGDRAFYGCWSLTGIQLPGSVAFVGEEAFGRSANSVTSEELCGNCGYYEWGGDDSSTEGETDDEEDVFYPALEELPESV